MFRVAGPIFVDFLPDMEQKYLNETINGAGLTVPLPGRILKKHLEKSNSEV